jgi:[acyl-carrier-protein] S-malonyltransferase
VLKELHFSTARFPIVQNVNAQPVQKADDLRSNLVAQISRPVRWIECMQKLRSLGCTKGAELGSGKVLAGLAKKIDRDAPAIFNINSLQELKALEVALKEGP